MLEDGGLKKALGDKALLSMDYHGKVSIKEFGDMGGGKPSAPRLIPSP